MGLNTSKLNTNNENPKQSIGIIQKGPVKTNGQLVQPVQSNGQPVQPVQSNGQPVQPVQSNGQPVQPVQPVQSVQPAQPEATTEPKTENPNKNNKNNNKLYPKPGNNYLNKNANKRKPVNGVVVSGETSKGLSSAAVATGIIGANNGLSGERTEELTEEEIVRQNGGFKNITNLTNESMRKMLKKNNMKVTKGGKYMNKKELKYQLKKLLNKLNKINSSLKNQKSKNNKNKNNKNKNK